MEKDILKEKRAILMTNLVNEIKEAITKNKIKGEKSSKIFIYSRLSDYTYYSEVSIRKFMTGIIPKELSSFIQGICEYSKLVKLNDEYIDKFVKEYVMLSNTVIIKSNSKIKTKNNIIPQDLSNIIRSKKLTKFLDDFLDCNLNIAYIYGYKLSGKTKSVMAYMSDLVYRNRYDNIIWIDFREKENLYKNILDTILLFIVEDKSRVDDSVLEQVCLKFLSKCSSIIILDISEYILTSEVVKLLKKIIVSSKVIILSSNTILKYDNDFKNYCVKFSMNKFIDKLEYRQLLGNNSEYSIILNRNPYFIDKLYNITSGFPFASFYILRNIIEENKLGVSIDESIQHYLDIRSGEYVALAAKIIDEIWIKLDELSKKILIFCSKFNFSCSIKLIAMICNIEVTDNNWRNSLYKCYENDFAFPIILNNPRLDMNNMIRILIKTKDSGRYDEEFLDKIATYYINISEYIGECYNDIDRLKILDELDELKILNEVLEYLYESKRYEEYIKIVRELKYYIYVRGIWDVGKNSIHLKRVMASRIINDKNEELEGLCDYINIMSKAKNKQQASKYLEEATSIVINYKDKIDKRILCLYYHVKALYIKNCLGDDKEAYIIWKENEEKYFKYINEYRRLVNRLWEDRCYINLEKDKDKIIDRLIKSEKNAQICNFTRAVIDYDLLIAYTMLEKYEKKQDNNIFSDIEKWLDKARGLLDKYSQDIRNEAFYYRLNTILSYYQGKDIKYNFEKAIKLYELMNCKEDIKTLKESIKNVN